MPVEIAALPRFSEDATNVCLAAKAYARAESDESIRSQHLLAAVLDQPWSQACEILRELGVDPRELRMLIALRRGVPAVGPSVPWSVSAKSAVKAAIHQHAMWRHLYVDTGHVLLGLLAQAESPVRQMLWERGITAQRVAGRMHREA
jgi:ATP-dependent Clp protease ATP-binding subunit ClpC